MEETRQQLELTKKELEAIGFIENHAPAETVGSIEKPARTWFSMPVTNAEFIYNTGHAPYVWYFKTNIGETSNWNWLDIAKLPELYVVLSSFHAKFKMAIF